MRYQIITTKDLRSDSSQSSQNTVYDTSAINKLLADKIDTSATTLSANIIQFNTATTATVSAGQVCWNPIDKTYDFGLEGGIVGQAFEEFLIDAHNETGITILNGQAVHLTSGVSSDGDIHVALASNNDDSALSTIAVATQDVLNGERGKFTKYGKVRDFNTSALTANQKVYLGTGGSLTSIQPSYPAHSVEIGYCIVSHATSGVIYVSIENNLAIEDLYNTTITNPQIGDSLIYENNKWINRNFGSITKEATGFKSPELVTVNYNEANRTITLSGSVDAYWRSNAVPQLSAGFVSSAHSANVSATQYLSYDGSNITWSLTPWAFDSIQIAAVVYGPNGEYIATLRETHGTMQWQSHKEFHDTIGCYLGSGGDISSYVLNSTISANRRPNIAAAVINDEDLQTTNDALTTKTYTRFSLSGASTMNFTSASTDIVALNGQLPYYNQFTGGNWVQTPFANNEYGAVFIFAMPVALDSKSQAKRFVFVQPQTVSTSLTTIQALTPNNVNLNGLVTLNPEIVFIGKIIIQASVTNFTLISVEKLTGTKVSQTAVTGNYLSTVSTDTTLSGNGTPSSPLGLNTNNLIHQIYSSYTDLPTSSIAINGQQARVNRLAGEGYFKVTYLSATSRWEVDPAEVIFAQIDPYSVVSATNTSASSVVVATLPADIIGDGEEWEFNWPVETSTTNVGNDNTVFSVNASTTISVSPLSGIFSQNSTRYERTGIQTLRTYYANTSQASTVISRQNNNFSTSATISLRITPATIGNTTWFRRLIIKRYS